MMIVLHWEKDTLRLKIQVTFIVHTVIQKVQTSMSKKESAWLVVKCLE